MRPTAQADPCPDSAGNRPWLPPGLSYGKLAQEEGSQRGPPGRVLSLPDLCPFLRMFRRLSVKCLGLLYNRGILPGAAPEEGDFIPSAGTPSRRRSWERPRSRPGVGGSPADPHIASILSGLRSTWVTGLSRQGRMGSTGALVGCPALRGHPIMSPEGTSKRGAQLRLPKPAGKGRTGPGAAPGPPV